MHSFNTTKYGLEALITMRALISRNGSWEEKKSIFRELCFYHLIRVSTKKYTYR